MDRLFRDYGTGGEEIEDQQHFRCGLVPVLSIVSLPLPFYSRFSYGVRVKGREPLALSLWKRVISAGATNSVRERCLLRAPFRTPPRSVYVRYMSLGWKVEGLRPSSLKGSNKRRPIPGFPFPPSPVVHVKFYAARRSGLEGASCGGVDVRTEWPNCGRCEQRPVFDEILHRTKNPLRRQFIIRKPAS